MQEFGFGALENIKFNPDIPGEQIGNAFNSFFFGHILPPGGDTPYSFRKRIFDSINDLPEGNSAMFCHSGVQKLFLILAKFNVHFLGNLGIVVLEFDDLYKQFELVGIFHGYNH